MDQMPPEGTPPATTQQKMRFPGLGTQRFPGLGGTQRRRSSTSISPTPTPGPSNTGQAGPSPSRKSHSPSETPQPPPRRPRPRTAPSATELARRAALRTIRRAASNIIANPVPTDLATLNDLADTLALHYNTSNFTLLSTTLDHLLWALTPSAEALEQSTLPPILTAILSNPQSHTHPTFTLCTTLITNLLNRWTTTHSPFHTTHFPTKTPCLPGAPPSILPSDCFPNLTDCLTAGLHGSQAGGIHGSSQYGAYSICINHSSAYADIDIDRGTSAWYSGTANPAGVPARAPTRNTQLLITACATGNPIRVIRGHRGRSVYAPLVGFRYDGLYRVTKAEHLGNYNYRFLVERCEGQVPFEVCLARPMQKEAAVLEWCREERGRRVREGRARNGGLMRDGDRAARTPPPRDNGGEADVKDEPQDEVMGGTQDDDEIMAGTQEEDDQLLREMEAALAEPDEQEKDPSPAPQTEQKIKPEPITPPRTNPDDWLDAFLASQFNASTPSAPEIIDLTTLPDAPKIKPEPPSYSFPAFPATPKRQIYIDLTKDEVPQKRRVLRKPVVLEGVAYDEFETEVLNREALRMAREAREGTEVVDLTRDDKVRVKMEAPGWWKREFGEG
ncbi:hypothetical protein BJ508DRAFT_419470 [Ascobolus immersus RN42]|uniref:YDG domain-containing protein n=1 Tax=Ascobolus immersus RN42 TaxID=1160509 RepID=A0A3N4HI83_ASCIM|nr:hypothetical protein BJ508DRAFT_419470 [Ascobolus immersus RN42]